MQSISQIKLAKTTARSEKNYLISELYTIYLTQKKFRKIDNWRRYVNWLKEQKLPDSPDQQAKFKKSKLFIKELPIKNFAFFLSRNSTGRLYEILSIAKDKNNRGENAASFIMANRFI